MDLRCPGCEKRLRAATGDGSVVDRLNCPSCGTSLRGAPEVLSGPWRINPLAREVALSPAPSVPPPVQREAVHLLVAKPEIPLRAIASPAPSEPPPVGTPREAPGIVVTEPVPTPGPSPASSKAKETLPAEPPRAHEKIEATPAGVSRDDEIPAEETPVALASEEAQPGAEEATPVPPPRRSGGNALVFAGGVAGAAAGVAVVQIRGGIDLGAGSALDVLSSLDPAAAAVGVLLTVAGVLTGLLASSWRR